MLDTRCRALYSLRGDDNLGRFVTSRYSITHISLFATLVL